MRGWAAYYQPWSQATVNEALGYFERALQIDPSLTTAQIGLAQALLDRFMWFGGEAVDVPRAEALVASALSAQPNNASAHLAKAWLFAAKKDLNGQFAETDAAIENDRNYVYAYANRGVVLTFAGRAAETIAEEETALTRVAVIGNITFATPTRIWRNGRRPSSGAKNPSRRMPKISSPMLISPPPTLGSAMTRRPRRRSPAYLRRIQASPCSAMRAWGPK
jgi:hypothetical protein